MKRGFALLLAALLVTALPASAVFTDVTENDWYYPAVSLVQEKGLMKGVSEDRFDPEGVVSRGMLATVLHRLAGSPLSVAGLYFQDIETGSWYIDSVIWCAEHDIVTGVDDTHFFPDHPVTREQVALMLWRQAGWPTPGTPASFVDAKYINGWAVGGVDWAYNAGILNGLPDGTFSPQGTATRAQIAQILMKYDQWRQRQGQ